MTEEGTGKPGKRSTRASRKKDGESIRRAASPRARDGKSDGVEEKYRAIFDNAVIGMFQSTREGRYLTVNPAFVRMYGFNSSQEIVTTVTDIDRQIYVNPSDRERFKGEVDRLGFVEGYETRHYKKNGEVIWVSVSARAVRDARGFATYYEGSCQDITRRRTAEDELRRSTQKYQDLVEHSNVVIWEVDRKGFVTYINSAPSVLRGFKPEDLLGRHFTELLCPEDGEKVFHLWEHLYETETEISGFQEVRIRMRSGSPRWMMTSGEFVRDDQGRITGRKGIGIDVTERKLMEIALAESESTYRTIFENTGMATVIFDEDTTVISHANPEAELLMGCGREELEGRSWVTLVAEEDRERLLEYNRLRKEDPDSVPRRYEFRLVNKEGEQRDASISLDKIPGTTKKVAAVLDVTDWKRAGAALRESEKKYRTLFENANDAIFLMEGGVFINCNSRSLVTFGCDRSDIVGSSPHRFSPRLQPDGKNSKEEARRRMDLALAGRPQFFEWQHSRLDGTPFEAEVGLTLIDLGGTRLLQAIVRDITERKQAERALLESEVKFRDLVEKSLAGVYLIQDNILKYVNSTTAEVLGYTVEELLGGVMLEDTIFPEDWPLVQENLRKRINGEVESRHYEFRIRRKSGEVRDVEVFSSRTSYQGRPACIGTLLDITERKRAEEALRMSDTRLRQVIDLVPHFIFAKDRSGRFILVNKTVADMYGTTVEDLTGKTDADFNPNPEEVNHFLNDDLVVMDSGQPTVIPEEPITDAAGRIRLLQTTKIPFTLSMTGDDAVIGVSTDITERRKAERALLESEAKYRSVVENSLVAFYIVQDNFFRFVNTTFCILTGYSFGEIVGIMGPVDLVHPDDREKVEAGVEKLLSGEAERIEYEFRALCKDGAVLTVKTMGSALTYNGRPAATATLIDITRERNLETQLRQAQKVEALGQLAGGIAHDFNNILTVLTGYASLLNMRLEKENPLRMYVDQILSASQKASGLTHGLLTFSRQQPITLSPVKINLVVRDTEKLLKRLLTEDIMLKTSLSSDDITIMADITQIDQILFNLTTNARDAMKKGGALTIETKLVALDKEFYQSHGFGEAGRYALLTVSDTGTGMDETTREKMYDPFFTTKEVGKGTGLGLSTVYGIVKQHGGHISVQSRPGQGTAFHIYFPAVRAVADERLSSPEYFRRGKETILVAEDDKAVRRFIKEVLTLHGYSIIEAEDGEDAIRKFEENREVDLFIFDSVMPRKNGREAYDAIVRIRGSAKVLFVSGYTKDVVLDKGVRAKEFAFISKPLSVSDLLRAVRQVLDS